MQNWHDKTPKPFQIETCAHVLKSSCDTTIKGPHPILLVRSTGGGKSAIRDCIGFCLRGVVLTIVPLLSLAADQTHKMRVIIKQAGLQTNDVVCAYNLDTIRSADGNARLQAMLRTIKPNGRQTIFLFSSPQKLTASTSWQKLIHDLVLFNSLSLVACDECHLFASQGMEFREEFSKLKQVLFDVIKKGVSCIPVLFITATASEVMVSDLEALTSLVFNTPYDLLWPCNIMGVQRRNVFIDLLVTESPLRRIKAVLQSITLSTEGNTMKAVVYSNSLKRVQNMVKQCRAMLNDLQRKGDIVVIHGALFREQKFHHTEEFVKSDSKEVANIRGSEREISFAPRMLFATSGSANAGLDCSEITTVVRDGFPPTIQDLVQEMGRAARRPNASASTDTVTICISFGGFVSLLFRIYVIPIIEQMKRESEIIQLQKENESNQSVSSINNQTGNEIQTVRRTSHTSSTKLSLEELQHRQY